MDKVERRVGIVQNAKQSIIKDLEVLLNQKQDF